MNPKTTAVKNIGKRCSEILDTTYSDERVVDLKQSIVLDPYKKRQTPLRQLLVAAVMLIAAGTAGWFLFSGFSDNSKPLDFKTGDNSHWQSASAWLQTDEGQARDIKFRQGSRIKLLPMTSLRVAEISKNKVRVYLNKGSVRSKIRGDNKTHWFILGGPYCVEVVGTEFTTSWIEESGKFKVSVKKGTVSVSGGSVGKKGILVFAGSTFKGTRSGYQLSNEKDKKNIKEDVSIKESVDKNSADPVADISSGEHDLHGEMKTAANKKYSQIKDVKKTKVSLVESDESILKDLCMAGGFVKIMKRFSSLDIDNFEQNGSLSQLWCLAKAARYTGNSKVAVNLLQATRRRFPGTEQSRLAAFFMGKVIEDLQGDPVRAQKWFKQYLKDDPSGSLADEAARKIQ